MDTANTFYRKIHIFRGSILFIYILYISANDTVCFGNVMNEFEFQIRNCSCQVECEENDYDIKLSNAKWPSKIYEVS